MNREVTQARIAEIVAMDKDPIKRNYEITQAYADISRTFRDTLSFDEANWCTFAAWASATAGDFIRGDEIPRFLLGHLADEERFSARLARRMAKERKGRRRAEPTRPSRIFKKLAMRVAEEIARGNLKVFRELAPTFVEMIDLYRREHRPTADEAIAHMRAHLEKGASTVDGQSRLIEAFSHYARAADETDATRRSQLVLHGNALVGFHEQIRLQPAIEGGLIAPFDLAVEETVAWIGEFGVFSPVKKFVRATAVKLLEGPLKDEVDFLRKIYRDSLTEAFMTLEVPGRTIWLGKDVPIPKGGIPFALQKENILVHNLPLALLLEGYGALTNGEDDSGARDWTRITDRMHFIIDLFRAYQREKSLFDEPLSRQEREALDRGELPVHLVLQPAA